MDTILNDNKGSASVQENYRNPTQEVRPCDEMTEEHLYVDTTGKYEERCQTQDGELFVIDIWQIEIEK